ncbi:MAG TPA: LptF/LptG family permease [Myxococcota bacterium]|nr:LptF/LptG family permease [Myxococcota bacterium]
MRWPRTLSLYVTREVVAYSLIVIAAFMIIFVVRGLVGRLDQLVGAGAIGTDLLRVASLLGAMATIYVVPASFLVGVVIAIARMSGDVEITAIRACGVGIRGLLAPIALLGVVLSLSTLALCLEFEPAARRDVAAAFRTMAIRGATIEPGHFNTVGDRMLYVDERDGVSGLRGILISDRTEPRRPFLVFAESGEMRLDEQRAELRLQLDHGDVHLDAAESGQDRYRRLAFDRLEYRIDVREMIDPSQPLRAREMPLAELRDVVRRIAAGSAEPLREAPPAYAANLERRYAISVAPVLFALVGVPLGMQRKRGARSYGAIVGVVLAFGYYALESFGESLAIGKGFPPRLALWLPNLGFAAVGLALLWRARRVS